ncbi:cytochrome P450 3A18-like [Penaeus japonicus]|uniref:cytochrome P450 3A18-like n=1 Tax=Penaeus japonicus TaxID=27405 RepID=UPI001C70BD94|nr:cytochrome P450 3A18-like [Penaeus japonicus]
MFLEVIALLAGVFACAWAWGSWCHGHWARQGVPSPPARPFTGHLHHVFSSTKAKWLWRDEAYHRHGGRRVCGLYNFLSPQLLVGDPELLRGVLVRDFDHFVDRRHLDLAGPEDQLWNDMLNNATADRWRSIRAAVTPAFTSSRLKVMFPLVAEKALVLSQVASSLAKQNETVEVKNLFGRFSMDATASCGFGMHCDSLNNNDSEFCRIASVIFNPTMWRIMKLTSFYIAPRVCRALGMRATSEGLLYFAKIVAATLNNRQETGENRGDFLDLMIESRKISDETNPGKRKHALDDITVVSQAVVFLLSGYDNNATTLAFCCYLLAKNPHLQEKAREEVLRLQRLHPDEGDEGKLISYEAVAEAKFLDACVSETLRLYPIETSFNRQCVKDYTLGDTGLAVKQGTVVEVPVWSLHRDPQYWKDPEEFRPERFLPENKKEIAPYTYLPFGAGPRNCVGQRFSYMVVKTALASLLKTVVMAPAEGHEDPPELAISPVILRPKNGVHLTFKLLAGIE